MKTLFLKRFKQPVYIFFSPWLLASAAGILIMIVVTFALHNFRLEERLMTDAMLQKAGTLMRVLHSGARESYYNDLRKDKRNNEAWNVHVQRMIDHLAEDPELLFVLLTDAQGKVIAHSDPARIGLLESLPANKRHKSKDKDQPQIAYSIEITEEFGRIFEAIQPFSASFHAVTPLLLQSMEEKEKKERHKHRGRRSQNNLYSEEIQSKEQYFVIIGLDMQEFDRTLGRLQMQIFMLSVAMLLVGLGGWFSLSAVQGFRISQKTLENIQAFTSLLIAKLPVGVIATDASGRITTWNRAVARLTGIKKTAATSKRPGEVLPKDLALFFLPDHSSGTVNARPVAETAVRLTMAERRCELLCHPLIITDSEQQYMGKVLLISDVTAIKSLEQRMRENERLAAVGRMAGGVAHEVRNPLSSIKGLALLLKNKFPMGSKEQDTADLLIQETERMNRTITEMLSFTRPSALRLESVNLAELLGRSLELIEVEAAENRIETALEIQGDVLPVLGDVDRLQQVIMNILINAMQAMAEGGKLSVTLANGANGQWVELGITDTGEGIAPEFLPQIFYPYFTTKQSGTGIGLAISQKIIVDHGGTIEVESEVGKGARVTIQLPAYQDPKA